MASRSWRAFLWPRYQRVRTVVAPIYLRLLVTAEPIDETTADNAVKVALAAARAGALTATGRNGDHA
jgi:hypothetical protein